MERPAVIGFASSLRHGCVPLLRTHPGVGVILSRVERGLCPVPPGDLRPQRLGTVATPIAPVTRQHLWRGAAAMALQSPCLLALFFTTRHPASAAASNRRSPTSVGRGGTRTCPSSGPAAKRSPIQCTSHVRRLPPARQVPRRARRSRQRGAILVRCAAARRRSSAMATHWRSHA